ncbi:type VI secretion system baseplate subunit TssK [Nostoc sp. 3335mG]|nr:type VI secretion system baseplate subunit TssK [Nostoc sp. 3335mG]
MSRFSKVAWSEGLFLRQHHLQQADRYVENLIEARVRSITPYPWGFARLQVDQDLAQQNKFGLRDAAGIFPDGTPFDLPGTSPLPAAIEVPEGAARQIIWLTVPEVSPNTLEIDMPQQASGSRFVRGQESVLDNASAMQAEQDIDIAHLRVAFDIRERPRPGFHCMAIARIVEVRDRTIVFDPVFAPPVLVTHAHAVVAGWLDRVVGWIEAKIEALARFAADPSSGGGLLSFDYFMLQLLNREINVLRHLRASQYVHPERLYEEFLRLSGELWTFSPNRLARVYDAYDHDDLQATFEPVLNDIQHLLNLDSGRATRLDLQERGPNAYMAAVLDRNLFRNATFVLEVSAALPLTQIQMLVPELCKVGPNTRMREITSQHLPGIALVHMPTPPRQIRSITDHVYFRLDKASPLWPEFSQASGLGLHFSGDWPNLQLDLWAIMEERR